MGQVVKHLPSKFEALSSNSSTTKLKKNPVLSYQLKNVLSLQRMHLLPLTFFKVCERLKFLLLGLLVVSQRVEETRNLRLKKREKGRKSDFKNLCL
jgi:hypothetical protein